ncbi:MAG: hypothetical protein DDT18_01853 [Actinobacteria bacterium]|nr:hypothetical protein [Actinomycetota bacterium]
MILKRLKYLKERISDWYPKKIIPPDRLAIRQVEINGYKMLVFANETVGRQIIWNKCYEKEETQFIYNFLKSTDVCLDIGANVGYFTLLMASKARQGQVYSFEPIPICYHLLNCSILLNNFTNVVVNNCAVGEIDGESIFYISMDSAFSSLRNPSIIGESSSISVPVVSIDNYVDSRRNINKVDFIKIDVEGAEMQVINGATSLLRDVTRRPRLIMLELVEEHLKRFSNKASDVIQLLRNYGYNAEILRNGKLVTFDIDNLPNSYNIFFCDR